MTSSPSTDWNRELTRRLRARWAAWTTAPAPRGLRQAPPAVALPADWMLPALWRRQRSNDRARLAVR